jgi:hypothetical protein
MRKYRKSAKRSLLAALTLSSIASACLAQEQPTPPPPPEQSSLTASSASTLAPDARGIPEAADPEAGAAPQNASSPSTPATPPPATAPSSSPVNQTATPPAQPTQNKADSTGQATSKDRLFYTLPNFLTLENAGQVPPMSAGE